jgi:hypothetical protein
MRRPNFFVVGAPRCGTTSLWSWLKAHPDIFMPAAKELFFFDIDLRGNGTAPSLKQYLKHFSAAEDQKKIGEATASYLRSQGAPHAIKAFSPAAQIIIMLRNPVDVMYSLYGSALYGLEPITDFEEALATDARRGARERIGYREFTDYPDQVQRYFEVFGRENVHTIIFDDLKTDSAAVYANTLRFLDVRLDFRPEFVVMSPNRQVRNIRLQQNLVRPPRVLRRIGAVLVPSRLRRRLRYAMLNWNVEANPRPPMDPKLRRRLQQEFKLKVEQLSKMIGRDLSGWHKDPNEEIRG